MKIIIIMMLVTISAMGSEYEACYQAGDTVKCIEYIQNCTDKAEGNYTVKECLSNYLQYEKGE